MSMPPEDLRENQLRLQQAEQDRLAALNSGARSEEEWRAIQQKDPRYQGWAEPPADGNPGRAFPQPQWNPPTTATSASQLVPPQPAQPPQGQHPRARLNIIPGSRLEQLLTHHTDLVTEKAAVEQRLKAVVAAIKREATSAAAPGSERIEIPAGVHGPELVVVWSGRRRRFDTTRFRMDQPDVYEQYRIPDPRWELRPVKGGG